LDCSGECVAVGVEDEVAGLRRTAGGDGGAGANECDDVREVVGVIAAELASGAVGPCAWGAGAGLGSEAAGSRSHPHRTIQCQIHPSISYA
jgi:hypothetical protein